MVQAFYQTTLSSAQEICALNPSILLEVLFERFYRKENINKETQCTYIKVIIAWSFICSTTNFKNKVRAVGTIFTCCTKWISFSSSSHPDLMPPSSASSNSCLLCVSEKFFFKLSKWLIKGTKYPEQKFNKNNLAFSSNLYQMWI